MKVTIIFVIFCCVALLPSIIHGDDERDKERIKKQKEFTDGLIRIAADRDRIHSLFKLSIDGFLGNGGFAVINKAKFIRGEHNGKDIALKFTPIEAKNAALREYEIYSYLGAINNPSIESFGIPAVYYFNTFNCTHLMMAITLLQPTLNHLCHDIQLTDFDKLIVFREFITISEYLHFAEIRHDDMKTENMMFNGNRAFIIDYNTARKMDEPWESGTLPYVPRNAQRGKKLNAISDWESFLYSTFKMVDKDPGWFKLTDPEAIRTLKKQTKKTLKSMKKIEPQLLKYVMLEFAEHVLDDAVVCPNYKDMHQIFQTAIKAQMNVDKVDEPALVSWLKSPEIAIAMQDWKNNGGSPKFVRFDPMPVNFDFFREQYHSDTISAEPDISSQLKSLGKSRSER